jgi:hypothetical protein
MIFKLLKFLTKFFAWLQIVASPTIVGIIFGASIYASKRDTTGLVIGIIIAFAGLLTGVIWATKVWKKTGTVEFMSKLNATPDLDNLEK